MCKCFCFGQLRKLQPQPEREPEPAPDVSCGSCRWWPGKSVMSPDNSWHATLVALLRV